MTDNSLIIGHLSCGPRGARTHDPNIKSVVLPKHQKALPFDATN